SASRLLMPMSTAALISGMTALIATAPNSVVSSELERNGFTGFHFFAFASIGLPILALGIVYMLFARHKLAVDAPATETSSGGPSLADWITEYKLSRREHRVLVTHRSPLVGKTLQSLRLQNQLSAKLIAIQRGPRLIAPSGQTELRSGD